MNPNENLLSALARSVKALGEQQVIDGLNALTLKQGEPSSDLTIIGNAGLHPIPEDFIHGEIYVASTGNLDLSSHPAILAAYTLVLNRLAEKLFERSWKRIYLVPTGPTTLILQIKLLVYHITRISTVDLFYSKGDYFEIELDYRSYLNSKKTDQP